MPSPIQDTIRNMICDNIVDRYTNLPSYISQEYKYVTREPMCEGMISSLRPGEAAISVFEETENVLHKAFSTTTKLLPITVEVFYKQKSSDKDWKTRKLSAKLNVMIAEIIKIMLSDKQCGNKALNIEEISNTIDVDGIYDDTVGFEVKFSISYRHLLDDPTQQV